MSVPLSAAQRVAEAADRAWHGAGAGTDEGVCVGVVAALALLGRADPEGPDPRDKILALEDEEVARVLGEVWCLFTIGRPELAMRCGPFGGWLNAERPDRHLLAGAGAVARATVKAGLFDLTLDLEVSRQVDLLGVTYTTMRSHSGRKARGEFYTPPGVAEAMARMSLAGSAAGQSICDPTAGTGGLLRAAAQAIRDEGKDPHDYVWYGCDIAPVAVAGLAVNAHIWGLGPQVVIGCADSLAEPDWEVRALREQREAIEAQGSRMKMAQTLAAMKALLAGEST
ncbi:MAG: N-6 DNA methylase [Actinobacteria bacterium]|nr:N-6 DNA methylase [Actinomycetota bacterium]MBS1883525.1 N-6 DNA methylase [Actinomycetota bacterium]